MTMVRNAGQLSAGLGPEGRLPLPLPPVRTGKLFRGYLRVADRCGACAFELKQHDSADGPAVFVMFIVGAVVVGLAFWLEFTHAPPYWLHAVLWLPAITVLSLVLLRPAKALLIALQYRHRAAGFGED